MTRGLRNKNPFNIKISPSKWIGSKSCRENTDDVFEQFYDIDYGLRAGMILLKTYIQKGYDTPRKIINRYAPSTENNTSNYLFFVSTYVPLDDVIEPFSEEFYKLCVAITKFESYCNYSPETFRFVALKFKLY